MFIEAVFLERKERQRKAWGPDSRGQIEKTACLCCKQIFSSSISQSEIFLLKVVFIFLKFHYMFFSCLCTLLPSRPYDQYHSTGCEPVFIIFVQ